MMMEGRIYKAIPAIMSEIGCIGKDSKSTQGFKYRGIDAVMNAINPSLIKNKVFIVPEVLEQKREERTTNKGANIIYSICKMRFKFCADDGSSVDVVTIGEGMDTGDKATNKAMSIAYKYACFQIFCIPTEEMKDPDAEGYELSGSNTANTGRNNANDSNRGSANKTAKNEATESHAMNDEAKNAEMEKRANASPIDAPKVATLKQLIEEKGCSYNSVLSRYKVERFEDMTFQQWNSAMRILNKM